MATLTDDLRRWFDQSRHRIDAFALEPRLEHIGHVLEVGDGVAIVQGLPETQLDELLIFEGGVRGLAVDLGEETIGCVLLGGTSGIPREASCMDRRGGPCSGRRRFARPCRRRPGSAARRRRAARYRAILSRRAAGARDRRSRAGNAAARRPVSWLSMP